MKIFNKHLTVLIAFLMIVGMQVQAQSKAEQEEKAKKLRQMEMEMKAEQVEMQKELQEALKEARTLEADELKSILEDQKIIQQQALKSYRRSIKDFEDNEGTWNIEYPTDIRQSWNRVSPAHLENYIGVRSSESTSLSIQKEIEELTFDTKFKYEVQKGSKTFQFSASGSVEEGTILIKLLNPAEKVIHEFEVSPLADVEWSQRFKWSEEDADNNFGTWTIIVDAEDATGHYQVSVRAN